MYYPLKLKKFTSKNINKKYIDENLIEELMKKTYSSVLIIHFLYFWK